MLESIRNLYESSHLDDYKWTLATGEVICVFGKGPDDPDAVNWGDQWRKIAAEIEAEIAENFMELPLDADGVPIRIGDELTNKNKPTDTYKVTAIADNGYIRIYHDTAHIHSSQCRHAKPDPLRERAKAFLRDYRGLNLKAPDSKLEAMLDAFCADVREMAEDGEL